MVGAIALVACALLGAAARAKADQVYWANQNSIAYSQLDDTAGGFLPASVNAIHDASGTAIDTANGRIYVSEEAAGQIVWFGLEGGGAGVVNTAPGSVDHPANIAIDPETQTLYWANHDNPGSIGFAFVNESGGGTLAQAGSTDAHVQGPTRLAIDTRHNRVYWWNGISEEFSWVTTDGLIGGNLPTPGLGSGNAEQIGGIALEPYSTPEELYFVNVGAENIFHTDPLLGGAPEAVKEAYGEKNAKGPTGLAFDEINEKFYWANSAVDEERKEAIGSATLFGHPANVAVFPVAPVHSPVFAAILKAPESLGEPQLSVAGTTMSCSLGEWEGDHPGAAVYAAPTRFSYQWKKGSEEIAGATGNTFTANETGSYSCWVTATNPAGETVKSTRATSMTFPSKPKTTTPSPTTTTSTSKQKPKPSSAAVSAKLASAKPVKVKAGGTAAVEVDLINSSGAASGPTKVCAKLSKQAKRGLKVPACVTVKSVAAGKTVVAKLSVKTLASAKGTYKFTVSISGAATASLTAKVQVTRPKSRK
ncbi:MAG TPA: hypothetical protein VHS74_05555 [Solirubrobacterales bacterium]|jgi:hypothetical protein|nr:hypothetical protein [Solirubrobacterales bacterium]